MLFNSYEFILAFLPVTLIVFFLLRYTAYHRFAIAWLVIASLFFYGWWELRYLLLIGFSIIFNFVMGRLLESASNSKADSKANIILFFGIMVNLALIAYFKYANFFVHTVSQFGNTNWHLAQIILPIGISFFTFQQIAYLVDTRRGVTQEHNFLQYCLFIVFFPQLIAGPIVHHRQMLPQFAGDKLAGQPVFENLAVGITIFAIGLFKKVIIADNLALVSTPLFDAAEQGQVLNFFWSWRGTLAYTLQLYFDFSGYSDMAIGLARMFGIRLPLNFHSPYQASSIIDFWRCWHMTLSGFLRDYVYIPLGGNKRGKLRRYANVLITMLLGGLWHGASWTFVLWGGLHGLFLIVNIAWRVLWPTPIQRWWSRLIGRLLTFIVVAMAWVFFRAESFEAAIAVFDGMRNLPVNLTGKLGPIDDILVFLGFRFDGPVLWYSDLYSLIWLVFWLSFLWLLPNTQQWMSNFKPAANYLSEQHTKLQTVGVFSKFKWSYWDLSIKWAVYTGILLGIAFLSLSHVSEFLYFQF